MNCELKIESTNGQSLDKAHTLGALAIARDMLCLRRVQYLLALGQLLHEPHVFDQDRLDGEREDLLGRVEAYNRALDDALSLPGDCVPAGGEAMPVRFEAPFLPKLIGGPSCG